MLGIQVLDWRGVSMYFHWSTCFQSASHMKLTGALDGKWMSCCRIHVYTCINTRRKSSAVLTWDVHVPVLFLKAQSWHKIDRTRALHPKWFLRWRTLENMYISTRGKFGGNLTEDLHVSGLFRTAQWTNNTRVSRAASGKCKLCSETIQNIHTRNGCKFRTDLCTLGTCFASCHSVQIPKTEDAKCSDEWKWKQAMANVNQDAYVDSLPHVCFSDASST